MMVRHETETQTGSEGGGSMHGIGKQGCEGKGECDLFLWRSEDLMG